MLDKSSGSSYNDHGFPDPNRQECNSPVFKMSQDMPVSYGSFQNSGMDQSFNFDASTRALNTGSPVPSYASPQDMLRTPLEPPAGDPGTAWERPQTGQSFQAYNWSTANVNNITNEPPYWYSLTPEIRASPYAPHYSHVATRSSSINANYRFGTSPVSPQGTGGLDFRTANSPYSPGAQFGDHTFQSCQIPGSNRGAGW